MSAIDDLLRGSIDMHIHCGPDARVERRVDALQAARQAQEAGMKAIVLKSHEYPTAPVAYVVSQVVSGITVFGSVTLDLEAGGLNTYALEASAKLGARVVWMPTLTSANDVKLNTGKEGGVGITSPDGKLLPVVDDILDIVKSYRMVLATGHVSARETIILVDRAVEKGLPKIVVTHPLWPRGGNKLSISEQQRLADKGAIVEYCVNIITPFPDRVDPMRITEAVKAVGAERCIMSSDLGQSYNPAPAEGLRMAIATMLRYQLTEKEIELMIKTNPAKLLGLD